MIKTLFALILLTSVCYAETIGVTSFKYVNTNENSTIINPTEAQDLLNIDITPGGKSFKKRAGYGLYKTVLSTSTGMHGGFHGYDSTGNDIQIWASSVAVLGIVADATPATIVSSMTVNSTIDCADTQGSVYCVNSSRNFYIRTNGASLTSWHTSPLGTMIEATPDRIAVAGVSATPNTIFVSGSNAFTTYTVGPLATDPFTEVIAAPGSRITHLRWGCQRLLWWKDQSFGYLDFEDQYSAQVKTISDNIGTFDNTSAIDPGGSVWFRGQDGHIYEYNCSGLIKQTIEITPQMQTSGRRSANSWSYTNATDFSAGTFSNTFYSGSQSGVVISTDNTNVNGESFEEGSGNNFTYWTNSPATDYTRQTSSSWGDNCGTMSPRTGSYFALTAGLSTDTSWSLSASVIDSVSSATITSMSFPWAINSCSYTQRTIPGVPASARTAVRIRFQNPLAIASSATLTSETFIYNGKDITFYSISDKHVGANRTYIFIDDVANGKNTIDNGLYYSAVKNAPNITSWGTFNAANSQNGGAHSFFIRSSTNTFTVLSSTPNWIAHTAGAIISASTGTYFQFKDSFTVLNATSTQNPILNNFQLNWFEGTASDQAYMLYFDNAIWATMAYGVGVSSNNYIFRRDLINQGWGFYNFGAGGMLIQNNKLYFGNVTDGNVFQFGSGTSDNGNAITAFWKSKDFTGNDPFNQSSLTQLDIFAKKNTGQSITSTYTMDTSTSTSYSVSLNHALNSYVQNRKLLPFGKNGYTFNIKLGDSSATSDWEIFGFRITYTTLPWKPTQ